MRNDKLSLYFKYISLLFLEQLFCASVLYLRKEPQMFDCYMSTFVTVWLLNSYLILLSIVYNYNPQTMKFIGIISILTNIGVMLQAVLIGDALYSFKVMIVSYIMATVVLVIYKRFELRTKVKLIFKIAIIMAATIYAILIILTVVNRTIGGTGTSVVLGSLSLQIIIGVIPLFIIIVSCIFTFEWKCMKKWKVLIIILSLNIMGLVLLNELGCAMIILSLFVIYCFLELEGVYTAYNTIIMIVSGGVGYLILKFSTSLYEHGNGFKVFYLLSRIYYKLSDRVKLVTDLFNQENRFQLERARQAMAVGGWFGSNVEVDVPVIESDFAFVGLIHEFGGLIGIFTIILLLILLMITINNVVKFDNKFERLVGSGFIFSVVLQALFTIAGSTGVIPLSGMPIPWLSQGGMYHVVVITEVMFLIVAPYTMKSKNQSYERKSKICREI